jgi:lipoprotein-releasing system ATP-binding protein
LEVRELRKAYASPSGARLEVLRGVSFTLAAGEMLAVTGASGAGKSTLLHLLGGLDAADGGSVGLGEIELTRARGAELARVLNEQIGFVFQFHHLLPNLSALENVALPLLVARRKRADAHAAARALLGAVGLGERAAHLPGELSGGEQQRTAIARALVHAPRLLLCDEPTGNLDARTGERVAVLLSTLARTRGAGVIIATHNEQLARTCDRTLVLEDGLLREL